MLVGGIEQQLGGGLLPHGLQHRLHLLPLPLGEVVRADPLLQELQAPLLLACGRMHAYRILLNKGKAMLNLTNSEELLGSPLIRSKAGNFADEVADKLVVLGQLALGIKEISSGFLFYLVSSLCGMIKY